jgi:hypothetical protein
MMQRNEGGYNRRDYLDDQGGPGAGRLEPLVQSARAHTEEHAQTLARLSHTEVWAIQEHATGRRGIASAIPSTSERRNRQVRGE